MVSWFKNEFAHSEIQMAKKKNIAPEIILDQMAGNIPPGSMGLMLQPFWSPGVKVPGPEAKGSIIGFGDVHTKAHIYRAILEGLSYALKEGADRTEKKNKVEIQKLRISGGGSQSKTAMQLTADIFNLAAEQPHTFETSALGAAIDAAVGLKVFSGFKDAVNSMTRISKTYEPGSVFKVLTMAAALDSGLVDPETRFQDTGSFYIGGTTIYNWNMGAWGDVDMTECLQYSLNVCMSWLSTEMGPDTFYTYLKNFGLDRKTGIDLGGESNWPLKLPGDSLWYEVDLATNSFGQGISLTPIQMVMATGSIANDGRMMAPHLVKAMIIDGKQYDVDPVVVGSPIKAETAHTLTNMLVNSLENEASNALVEGYSVAGKTGTGEIATPYGYSSSETNASFVGWGPAEDPKFLVYVWLEKPSISIWGSEVAAPVFSDLVSKLVVLMDIPPDSVRLAGSNTMTGQ